MEIKCDHCGVVAETIMPETMKDGEVEHTFFRCPDCGALYPISATDTMYFDPFYGNNCDGGH